MKKFVKIAGFTILIVVVLIIILLFYLSKRPAVPQNYVEKVETGGDIEAKYLKQGIHAVSCMENGAMHTFKKYLIYYPSDISEMSGKLPVVIFCNGTGIPASKYPGVLEHLASWGFIVMATEEEYAWNGFSAEMCIRLIEKLNSRQEVEGYAPNPFYEKVDMENIGLSGHSQGGVGVINAATENKHSSTYKTIFAASPANMPLATALEWEYDPSEVKTSIFLVSSTGDADENLVVNLEGLQQIYDSIPDTVTKVMARRSNADHGDMLYFADGYMTAWFMWQLQGDENAAKAFIGDDAEILHNLLYQDQKVS